MRSKSILVTVAIVLLVSVSSAVAVEYQIIDLGTVGGDESVACSINDSGQIVGGSDGRACLFDPTGGGANIDLGSLGGSHSNAWSINNNGQIVGYAFTGSGNYRACLFDPTGGGANTDLGTLGGHKSGAFSINDSGQIVGQAETPYPWWSDSYACIFDPTGDENNISIGTPDWIPLGYLSEAAAYSINDSGQIVGQQVSPISDLQVACLFYPENVWPLFLDDNPSSALFINNNSQIVGYSGISGLYSSRQACLFDPTGGGANTDLGTLLGYDFSEAWCINDSNQIVGYAYNDFLYPRACLFDPTGGGDNIDLNTLIDPSLSWTLQRAYSVNSDGWIVGVGINPSGEVHAYLLTPEPTKPALAVAVDIKPGSCPNPLNVKSSGVLPVAVLGSADVNVLDIDPTSIAFSIGDVNVGAIRCGYEDVAAPVSDNNDCNCITDGPDGFLDLTLKFKIQRIVEAVGDVNDGDVLTLELTGVLFDPMPFETHIEGADCILICGRHKPINPADINKDGVVNAADFAIFVQNWLQSSIVDE